MRTRILVLGTLKLQLMQLKVVIFRASNTPTKMDVSQHLHSINGSDYDSVHISIITRSLIIQVRGMLIPRRVREQAAV